MRTGTRSLSVPLSLVACVHGGAKTAALWLVEGWFRRPLWAADTRLVRHRAGGPRTGGGPRERQASGLARAGTDDPREPGPAARACAEFHLLFPGGVSCPVLTSTDFCSPSGSQVSRTDCPACVDIVLQRLL